SRRADARTRILRHLPPAVDAVGPPARLTGANRSGSALPGSEPRSSQQTPENRDHGRGTDNQHEDSIERPLHALLTLGRPWRARKPPAVPAQRRSKNPKVSKKEREEGEAPTEVPQPRIRSLRQDEQTATKETEHDRNTEARPCLGLRDVRGTRRARSRHTDRGSRPRRYLPTSRDERPGR